MTDAEPEPTPDPPDGLEARGQRLWRDVHALVAKPDPAQLVILEEACRMSDRLDRLDAILRGKSDWLELHIFDSGDMTVTLNGPLAEARQQQNVLKQLLVALRLPDSATGARPQSRPARGAHTPKGAAAGEATVTAIDRASRRTRGA